MSKSELIYGAKVFHRWNTAIFIIYEESTDEQHGTDKYNLRQFLPSHLYVQLCKSDIWIFLPVLALLIALSTMTMLLMLSVQSVSAFLPSEIALNISSKHPL